MTRRFDRVVWAASLVLLTGLAVLPAGGQPPAALLPPFPSPVPVPEPSSPVPGVPAEMPSAPVDFSPAVPAAPVVKGVGTPAPNRKGSRPEGRRRGPLRQRIRKLFGGRR